MNAIDRRFLETQVLREMATFLARHLRGQD